MRKGIRTYGTYKRGVAYLFVVLVCLMFMTTKESYAGVMSVDDIGGFGAAALTRDTDQMLDFLDVNLSVFRSVDDVSDEFGLGGDFEGFRYSTVEEWTSLIDHYGGLTINPIPPLPIDGTLYHDEPGDSLSGLRTLIGEVSSELSVGWFNLLHSGGHAYTGRHQTYSYEYIFCCRRHCTTGPDRQSGTLASARVCRSKPGKSDTGTHNLFTTRHWDSRARRSGSKT